MPLPSSETDLKRRARRRLIGAVALILLAVIILPLLLEDEPPPASPLAVRMAREPVPPAPIAPQPIPAPVSANTSPPLPPIDTESEAMSSPAAASEPIPPNPDKTSPKHETVSPELTNTVKPREARPAPEPAKPPAPVARAEPAKPPVKPSEPVKPREPVKRIATPEPAPAANEQFVVQLAALSDAAKADTLKARAAQAGLPAFTDRVGSLTRVRVGPFPTRAAAVAAAVKLAEHDMAGQVLSQ